MPPKSKQDSRQSPAQTVLDDKAQQANSGDSLSSAPAPGATDAGDGQPIASVSESAGPSSSDAPDPSASEVQQHNSSGPTLSGVALTGGKQPLASAAPPSGVSLSGAPFLSEAEVLSLPRYQVTGVSSIQHDGTWYEAGDDIYLSDHDARGLLDGRFIEPTEEL